MKYPFTIVFILLLISCKDQQSNIDEFKTWFKKNENLMVKERKIGNLTYTIYYRPIGLLVLNELMNSKPITPNMFRTTIQTYGDNLYFLMELSTDNPNLEKDLMKYGLKSYSDFQERIRLLAFGISNNVSLIYNEEIIVPNLHHFERGYELGRTQRILFSFPKPDNFNSGQLIFSYRDEIFNSGILNFKFDFSEFDVPEFPETI